MNELYSSLAVSAIEASKGAYVPYSKFPVGAALLCEDGTVVLGCNIENSSFGATICAERTAMCKAVSEGHRKFTAIAIFADVGEDYIVPCGICRQFMSEFCPQDFPVIRVRTPDDYVVTPLGTLLPGFFSL